MVKPRNLNLAVLRNDPNEIYEGTCLSTDTKPTNWPDNSILFELDTGTRYYSNSGTWYPVGGGDDGGSSGGGGGDYVVFMHDYNTGEVKYESSIELTDLDASKKVNFYIADTDFTVQGFWGNAFPCCTVSYDTGYGSVSAINILPGNNYFTVLNFAWEIVNNQPVLTFRDSTYALTIPE